MKSMAFLVCIVLCGCSIIFEVENVPAGNEIDAGMQTGDSGSPEGCSELLGSSFNDTWESSGNVAKSGDTLTITSASPVEGDLRISEILSRSTYAHTGLIWTVEFLEISTSSNSAARKVNLAITTENETYEFIATVAGTGASSQVETSTRLPGNTVDDCGNECDLNAAAPFGLRIRLGETQVFYEKREGIEWETLGTEDISSIETVLEVRPVLATFAEQGEPISIRVESLSLAQCTVGTSL